MIWTPEWGQTGHREIASLFVAADENGELVIVYPDDYDEWDWTDEPYPHDEDA